MNFQDLKQSEAFAAMAKEMIREATETRERLSFQEGVESAG